MIKTGVIYCRVSTSKQEKNGDSLERQEKACMSYCNNNNIQVKRKPYKEVFTGKNSNRTIFQEAINEAIKSKVDYFVIFDIDRFSREGYEKYSEIKQLLQKNGITLRDSKNIIGEEKIVIENDVFDTSIYKWNMENPNEMSEMVLSSNAKSEGKKMLQRTIPKEISLEQNGYKVRQSNFGYTNKTIKIENGKGTIQIKDLIEGEYIEKIFNLRAKGLLNDNEIVENINAIGYKSRNGNKLTVKQMQIYIKNPIYAGVICSKWTSYKPIKTAYEGLVSISVWNSANKGKIIIVEGLNGEIKLIKGNIEDNDSIELQRRNKFDINLPFRNLVKSSALEDKLISGSFSSNRKGNKFGYYHPIRKKGKQGENIKKEDFESNIYELLNNIRIDGILKELFLDRFETIFNENIKEVEKYRDSLIFNYKQINKDIQDLEDKICIIDLTNSRVLKTIENKLGELEKEKEKIEMKIKQCDEGKFNDISSFKDFCFNILEHLDILVKQSQSFDELNVIFKFIFKETPSYNEIINRTPNIYPIFTLQSQQKNPSCDEFSNNLNWQPKL